MIGDGAKAGAVGAVTMSISTNLEMRLRGRQPSTAPAKALERLLGIRVKGERAEQLLVSAAHLLMSVSLGIGESFVRRTRRPASAGLLLLGASLIPELIVVPALGAAEPPWEWSREETAVAVLHHAVYAAATAAALERLRRRA